MVKFTVSAAMAETGASNRKAAGGKKGFGHGHHQSFSKMTLLNTGHLLRRCAPSMAVMLSDLGILRNGQAISG